MFGEDSARDQESLMQGGGRLCCNERLRFNVICGMGWKCKSEFHLDMNNNMAEGVKDCMMMGKMLNWRL